MQTFLKDLQFSLRTLAKNPGFTLVAALSLALGIGANTTIFTLINAVFLNPLPVERPSELVALFTVDANNPGFSQMSYPNYEDFRDENEVFSGLAGYGFPIPSAMSTGGEPQQVFVETATGNYFEVLGVTPAIGRFFLPEEDVAEGARPVAVLSYGLWSRQFGQDPAVLRDPIIINGTTFDVIGVAPEGFKGVNALFSSDVWVPHMMYRQVWPAQFATWVNDRRALIYNVAGRLKPEVTLDQARAHLTTIAAALEEQYPKPNKDRSADIMPLTEATIFPAFRGVLVVGGAVLMAVVGFVLLIACVNVASLLLAKASSRRKEIAVRLSMGAQRPRLIRQLLTESILLGLLGGALGLVVAIAGRDFIWSFRPAFIAVNFVELTLDARVLLFTFLVSLGTGVLFGLVPAIQSSRPNVVDALKEETRTAGGGTGLWSFRSALVVVQVALSIVCLVSAGLFLRSMQQAQQIDPGFDTEKLAVTSLNPGQAGYDQSQGERFYDELRQRLEGQGGVSAVSWSSNLPLFGGFQRTVFVEGQKQEEDAGILVMTRAVDTGYFATTGTSLLQGRDFTLADREETIPVAVINEKMAEDFWPEKDPIGERFQFYGDDQFREIVGLVETTNYGTLGEDPIAAVFVPMRQNYADTMILYVKTEADPSLGIAAARRVARDIDPLVPFTNSFTVEEVIDQSLWAAQLGSSLLAILGFLALALASVGLYGVMAYNVTQRNQEIGLRIALGAGQRTVLQMVLKQSMILVGIGAGIGLGLALFASRALTTLLYGISTTDPATYAGVTLTLLAVALVASLVPALRACRVDPLVALRYE